ncbi:YggS family pyridoxal phosphate-dependent enzyme [Litorivivens sp.]|uniref:YggS family pyridoxal phosphate-dependent enzyme n=3 Tax=Litorivivens sp. TaxID=2020868 RepID=UPI003564710D
MIDEALINRNIAELRQRIRLIAQECGRDPNDITVLAVSKTRPAAAIRVAASAGLTNIGENYIQEAVDKQLELQDLPLQWHCIGPLQSNKTRLVAEHFHWAHTVDRLKIAQRLNDQRPSTLPALNVCLQVNIDREPQKAGVAPDELKNLAEQVATLPNLMLRGVMAIPAARDDTAAQRQTFAAVRACFQSLQGEYPQMDTLSMGMSRDFPAAIAEGSTLVRIGTDIFGART